LRKSAAPRAEPAERLQKVLAQLGLASRREVEAWIRAGRLTVNGAPATLGVRVRPADQVRLDGRVVRRHAAPQRRVFACHRSPGATLGRPQEEGPGESAMASRLPTRAGRRFIAVSPMPRIDGGLELLTSDGALALQLQRAAHRLESEFSVRVRGELTPEQRSGILSGVLDRGTALVVERCESAGGGGANCWYAVSARGGSGKDVRQLFERQAVLVSRVLRTRFGPVTLARTLGRGQFRELTRAQTDALVAALTDSRSSSP
jgi:23S rRNA pseudouridine2605 synthase